MDYGTVVSPHAPREDNEVKQAEEVALGGGVPASLSSSAPHQESINDTRPSLARRWRHKLSNDTAGRVYLYGLFAVGLCVALMGAFWDSHTRASDTFSSKNLAPSRLTIGPPLTHDVPSLGATQCCTTEFADGSTEATTFEASLFRETVVQSVSPRTSAVVYVVATEEDRLGDLEAVLARLDTHFSRLHDYPVVVYMAGYNITQEIATRLKTAAPSTPLDFRPVSSVLTASNKTLALWEFRTLEAPKLLASEYEWALHVSEATLLSQDVLLDPFLALQATKRKCGYVAAHKGMNQYGLWDEAKAFVMSHGSLVNSDSSFSLTSDAPKFIDTRWIVWHRDVFTSQTYQALHAYLISLSLAQAVSKNSNNASLISSSINLPSEEALLTLGSLITLKKDDFMQYRGLTFQRPPSRPTGLQGLSPEEATGITVSEYKDIKMVATAATDLQPLFAVRNEGWLGADVATSFRFPRHSNASVDDPGKFMWVFGDTLLGYASPERRLRGSFFMHNTIAFTPAWKNPALAKAEEVQFAWNISQDGCPTSIFVRKVQDNECLHSKEYLWPISGMGVDYDNTSKLIIIAIRWAYLSTMSASVDLFDDNIFNFQVLGSTIIVVDNPHDEPQKWNYRQRDMPGTDENVNWYSAMLHEDRFADLATGPDQLIYLFGVNNTEIAGSPPQTWQYETLSRVPVRSLVDLSLDGMEVWATTDGKKEEKAAWKPYRSFLRKELKAAPLVFPVFSETSVRYSEVLGAYYGVVVDWLATQILLYVSEELTGMWEPVVVYKIPPPFNDPNTLMAYAGKTHPELAREDELVLTFMTNAPGDLEPLYEDGAKDIYVPIFVRLKFLKDSLDAETQSPVVPSS